jgi:serine/threonine protein kinase
MDKPARPPFRRAAVIGGLLTAEQLAAAETQLRASRGIAPEQPVPEDMLAAKLIELGLVNEWQCQQLKLGRTKFTLGPYHVVDSIGQGGMGQVFKAQHRVMGRTVAIKVLPRNKSSPDAIASFTHEIRAQAQLDHENLVRAYDAGHDGNVHFLVTEYVPGTDLRKFVRARGKLSQQEAATIISQAAAALDHAHRRGLIHRDIKPGNLLVTPSGKTKLSDLGLAAFLESTEDDPRAGKIVGTVDYIAPECVMNPHDVKPLADIYSLGCTLYYAVTGKVPFPGGTTREKAKRHCEATPINPKAFNPTLSDDFVRVLEAMMEKDPAKRIPNAAEVVLRMAPWAAEAVVTTSPETAANGNGATSSSGTSSSNGNGKGHDSGSLAPSVARDSRAEFSPWELCPGEPEPMVVYPRFWAGMLMSPLVVSLGFLVAALVLLAR